MPRKIDPGTIQTGSGVTGGNTNLPNLTAHTALGAAHSHIASSISIVDTNGIYESYEVEGALSEISASLPPKPPTIGNYDLTTTFTGIPDWGILSSNDLGFDPRNAEKQPFNTDSYLKAIPSDPRTDPIFNLFDRVLESPYVCSSPGAFVRASGELVLSHRILPYAVFPTTVPCTVSGSIYPADRGVLALLHFPPAGGIPEFLAQPLIDRCVAATLLGKGIDQVGFGISPDGTAGGIFNTDFQGFPSRAAGQYDLYELHSGLSTIDGSPLPIVADNTAGQVRLGVNPKAGVTPVVGGIAMIGGTSISAGGGDDNSFLKYRLPYLADYSFLRYTPEEERLRYYQKPTLALDASTDLTNAGDYPGFQSDCLIYQVARFRHVFTLNGTSTYPTPRESGSFILVHFKKEAYFEEMVRDGIVPTDDKVYSANLVNWANVESIDNLVVDSSSSNYPPTTSYHVIRSAIYEDADYLLAGGVNSANTVFYFNTPPAGPTTQISGIYYFGAGLDSGSPELSMVIESEVEDIFYRSFYTGGPTSNPGDIYISNDNPISYNLFPYANSSQSGIPNYTISAPYLSHSVKDEQYIGYTMYGFGYSTGSPPPVVSNFLGSSTGIELLGDVEYPTFTDDAFPYVILRKPPKRISGLPTLIVNKVNNEYDPSVKYLMHSTRFDRVLPSFNNPLYGNFNTFLASQFTAQRDTEERFLDEVYRWSQADMPVNLIGPGLPSFVPQNGIRVRDFSSGYNWVDQSINEDSLVIVTEEAQVAGLTNNPAYFQNVMASGNPTKTFPQPSSGMLVFPQIDYTANYRPSNTDGDIAAPQYDYSSIPGTGDRSYVRPFDVAFSRSGTDTKPDSTKRVFLKLKGLVFNNIDFTNVSFVTPKSHVIYVKVPGLTTWMDAGRLNLYTGLSKQDGTTDGAGCLVQYTQTYNSEYQHYELLLELDIGPDAYFYRNLDSECVLLVKVVVKDNVSGLAANWNQITVTGRRALIGIEIVRPPT